MKLQIQHDLRRGGGRTRLPYPCALNSTENNAEILKLYLKDLTFQGLTDPLLELANEETEKLRRIIDRVYRCLQQKELALKDVEGIWPLLTFSFEARCGLELYLHFESLMAPASCKSQIIHQGVKAQHVQTFNPQGYFQNNDWKHNKNFMKSIRALEKKLPISRPEALDECFRMLRVLQVQVGQSSERQSEFKTKLNDFLNRIKVQNINKEKYSKLNSLTKVFGSRMFSEQQALLQQQFVLSEPEMLHNTFTAFSHTEYTNLHKTRSVAKAAEPIMEEQEESERMMSEFDQNQLSAKQSRTIKHKRISVEKLSSPTKRRAPCLRRANNSPNRRQIRRPPRHMMVKRFFELERNKNIILEEIKEEKKRKDKQKKRQKRVDRIQMKICCSDEDEDRKQRNRRRQTVQVEQSNDEESQYRQESRYSNQLYRRMDKQLYLQEQKEDSEEIVMRRKTNQYKKPQFIQSFIEEDSYDQSYNGSDEAVQQKMDIEEDNRVVNSKFDPYSIGKIKCNNAEDPKTSNRLRSQDEQNLQNLQIRKLALDEGCRLNSKLDFPRYQDYLSHLEAKEVKRQVQKIVKQAINRQNMSYDIDLTLKIIAVWTMSKLSVEKKQQAWEQMTKFYINPLLKFVISANCYRAITEVLNNFFVSAVNEDLSELSKAGQYFKVLFQVGRSFSKYNLEEQLLKVFYESMITPKRLEHSLNPAFFVECQMISLKNPFKLGTSESKFKLNQRQNKIAYLVGSLVIQTIFMEGSVSSNEYFKSRKGFLSSLKQQLKQLNANFPPQWFYSLTKTIKKFYSCYDLALGNDYFMTLVGIVNLSLEKLMLESITCENDVETRSQTDFLLNLISYYINLRIRQGTQLDILNIISYLTVASGINKVLKDQKDSIISYMAYSSVLRLLWKLLIPLPFDANRKNRAINVFMKYLTTTLEPNFPKIVSPLKTNIYLPIFHLISQIYAYQIQHRLNRQEDTYLLENQAEHKEIRGIIERLWESLDKKYDEFNRHLDLHFKQLRNSQSKDNSAETQKQIAIFQGKIDKCEKSIKVFLRCFLLPQAHSQNNQSLKVSLSHYFFGLDFVLKQNYFLKHLKKRYNQQKLGELQQAILQILHFWLASPRVRCQQKKFEQRYYQSIIEQYKSQFDLKRELEHHIMVQSNEKVVEQSLAMIYGTQLVAAAQYPRPINPPESNIIRLVKSSVTAYSNYSVKFSNIKRSVCYLDFLLERMQAFISEKAAGGRLQDEKETSRIKQYFWEHFFGKFVKDVVLLVFLAFATKNFSDFQDIPLNSMIRKMQGVLSISSNQINYKDAGYYFFLYTLQNLARINSITDVLTSMQEQAKVLSFQDLDKQLSTVLKDLYPSLKRLQQVENNKQATIIESIRILCFILQRPQPSSDLIKYYLKEMQLISSVDSLITKIRLNEQGLSCLLSFFQCIGRMNENPHKIKETMGAYIHSMTSGLNCEHLRQAKRLLTSLRASLASDASLQPISRTFLKQFLQKFCSVHVLETSSRQIALQKLEIFLEMMKSSLLQRRVYEQMIVENRKKYEEIIPRLMLRSNAGEREVDATLEKVVLTSMIGRHSDLLDLKRLLGAMKKDAMDQLAADPARKQTYYDLFNKLKSVADDSQAEQIAEWCEDQLREIRILDLFEQQQSMDIE